jgi:hypothetical protein
MNERRIRENIRKLLFEDHWVANATDDKSAGKFVVDSDEEAPVPIAPSPQMASQFSTDLPPITDDDYIPTSSIELAKSLYALFEDCPQDQIEWVYRQSHRLRETAQGRASNFKIAEPEIDDSMPLPKPVKKSSKQPEEKQE